MFNTFIIIILSFLVGIWIFILTSSSVHISMTKGEERALRIIRGNYKKFVEEFNKQNWEYDKDFNSFFVYNNYEQISKVHASIYMFNNIGMLIYNPIDYLRIQKFLNNKRKEYSKNLKDN